MARRSRSADRSTSSTSPRPRPSPAFIARSPARNRCRSDLIAGAQLAGLPMFFGSYPITPASPILHHLSRLKEYGITTFQAEDEIAAICAAMGASYAGHLGVTSSSGPGIALKGEAMGLAVMTELAAGDHQFAARRAVDRPSDQDRAVGPLSGGLWPQRRCAAAGDLRPLAGRRIRMRDRGGPDRDPLHDPGDASDRRLYRQCGRAVEGAGHERLRSRSRSASPTRPRPTTTRCCPTSATAISPGRGSSRARRASSIASAGSRRIPAPATSTIRPRPMPR